MNKKISKYVHFIIFIGCFGFSSPFRMPKGIDYIEEFFMKKTYNNCSEYEENTKLNYNLVKDKASEKIQRLTINHLITTDKREVHKLSDAHLTIPTSPNYDPSKPVFIFSHGYMGNLLFPLSTKLRSNMMKDGSANFYFYNHTLLTSEFYSISCANSRIAGEVLGEMLLKLYANGVKNISCAGISLGAHICGFAGKVFRDQGNPLFEKITGIDPSGPCYYNEVPQYRLDRTDAKFVNVIHTDSNAFGIAKSIGHVDIHPNGGENMLGCVIPFCSHVMSLQYYAESVLSKNFLGVKCSDWNTFKSGACANNTRTLMGFSTPTDTPHGDYYLYVRMFPKYALGEKGIAKPKRG